MSIHQNQEEKKVFEMAQASGLQISSIEDVINLIKADLLITLYTKESNLHKKKVVDGVTVKGEVDEFKVQLNERIKKAWAEMHNGAAFDENALLTLPPCALMIYGPPGQGKTHAYKTAGKEVAAMLDLNYVDRVTEDYMPNRDDLLMLILETAGENSALTFGGAPKASVMTLPDGTEVDVLKRAINSRFMAMHHAAGGVFLLDDAANANETIQNVFLSVAQEKAFQGVALPDSCLVGFTGNLGALDGTFVQDQSTALKNRVLSIYMVNYLDDFIKHQHSVFNDDLGDLGLFSFLKRNPEIYRYDVPDEVTKAGHVTPRSLEIFLQRIRVEVVKEGGRQNLAKILPKIEVFANNLLGPDAQPSISAYYQSYVTGADPLARRFVLDGVEDIEEFNRSYGTGQSASSMIDFSYQFGSAAGDYMITKINQEVAEGASFKKAFKEATNNYLNAVLLLDDTSLSFAIDHMKNKLARAFPALSEQNKRSVNLKSQVNEDIFKMANEHKLRSRPKMTIMTLVLSNYINHNNSTMVRGADEIKKAPRSRKLSMD